jgi:hypothetical protein
MEKTFRKTLLARAWRPGYRQAASKAAISLAIASDMAHARQVAGAILGAGAND